MKNKINKVNLALASVMTAGIIATTLPVAGQQDQTQQPQPPAQPPQNRQPQPPNRQPGGQPNRGGRFFGNMLDDKQQQLLMEAMQTNAADINALQEKLRIAQQELVKAVLAEKYDEQVVRQKAEAVAKLQVEMTMLRAKAISAVTPTLTVEQKQDLENSPFISFMLTSGGFGGRGGFGAAGAAGGRGGFGGGAAGMGPGGGFGGAAGMGLGGAGMGAGGRRGAAGTGGATRGTQQGGPAGGNQPQRTQ